jgi:hypothetical protein
LGNRHNFVWFSALSKVLYIYSFWNFAIKQKRTRTRKIRSFLQIIITSTTLYCRHVLLKLSSYYQLLCFPKFSLFLPFFSLALVFGYVLSWKSVFTRSIFEEHIDFFLFTFFIGNTCIAHYLYECGVAIETNNNFA